MAASTAPCNALTLQLLPRDVKLLFVDFIAEHSRPSLFQLSLVNKEWQALVEPRIWETLRISRKPIDQLALLALQLMPRVGTYVYALALENWSDPGLQPPTSAAQQEVTKYEDVLRLPNSASLNWNERVARVQNGLLGRAVRLCTELCMIAIDESLAVHIDEEPSSSWWPSTQLAQSRIPNQLYPAIECIGTNIDEVHLRFDTWGMSRDFNEVTRLIGSFPACRSLRLELRAFEHRTLTSGETRAFMKAVHGLKELRALYMTSCSNFDRALLEHPQISLPKHLRQLAIYESPLSPRALCHIGDLCGQYLVELTLSNLNKRGNILSFGNDHERPIPAKFTALERLSFETDFDASLFALFANSPLRSIDLRGEDRSWVKSSVGALSRTINALQFIGVRDSARSAITPDEMRRFLVAQKSTLQTAHVSEHLIKGTGRELDALNRWFGMNHIEGGLYHAC
ncbi:hypothetical protein JCM10908_001057 [Rhodotorula pacifica]|uniref:uncharacterized protein n=1 Tax=Rhodotorula pacifica TaxID=1495444 RepID=UPI003176CE53